MYYYLLLALLSINAWAMKRVDTYSNVKEEIIKTQEGKDPFNNSIGYADTIFIKYQNKYVPCHVTSLYERLCEKEEKKKDDKYRYLYSGKKINDVYKFLYKNDEITSENTLEIGLEITPEQENMIKFYYQSLPLAENMTREELDNNIPLLFELYLNRTALGEKASGRLKRFFRYEHLSTHRFPYLNKNHEEIVKIIEPKLEELEGKWSLRRSFTYEDDHDNFSYCIVIFYVLNKKIIVHRIFYQSGMGFYVMVSEDERKYYTNFIDVLDSIFNDKKITKNNYIKGL